MEGGQRQKLRKLAASADLDVNKSLYTSRQRVIKHDCQTGERWFKLICRVALADQNCNVSKLCCCIIRQK